MIFKNPPRLPSREGTSKYVQNDLFLWMKNLSAGLSGRLDFSDNFVSFLAENVKIPAGGTAEIPNQLPVVPNERFIARQTGNGVLTDGNWDINTVRIVNNGAVEVTASIRFFAVT